jgi:serine/threonine protein kinase
VKPHNIFLDEQNNTFLADFGLAAHIGDRGRCEGACGTREYVAPEILWSRPYGFPMDMWALGVTLYEMLTGNGPFADQEANEDEFLEAVAAGTFNEGRLAGMSNAAKDLITRLLDPQPERRMTAEQAIAHPFWDVIEAAAHVMATTKRIDISMLGDDDTDSSVGQ